MHDLSVVIPARNERWLSKTIEDILEHIEADTEIIAVLDGAWSEPGLPQHARVTVVYLPESIGQRAATNLGMKLSTATYVMKLDAHCAVAQGFDRVLIESAKELGPDVTQIPSQRNLHVFDRVCKTCGKREYQGPTTVPCTPCGETNWDIDVVWKADRRRTDYWTFDSTPKFQYAGEMGRREEYQGEIADVMSSLGACFFMSRERFWQLGGLDEAHGSWGSFGIEIACKSWLSGGRQVVNKRTWFSHLFRTQGHDFSFPYAISGAEQDRARAYSRDLWFNNKWPGQVRPLRWLVEKFWPVQGWAQEQLDALPRFEDPTCQPYAGIVYYSDCQAPQEIAEAARRSIEKAGLPIAAVTLKPIDWPAANNYVLDIERSYLSMFKQILLGLEALNTAYVFFAEHDVIYDASHWKFMPPSDDVYYYNLNWLKVDAATGKAVTYVSKQTSQLCANRQLLVQHYRTRVERVEREGFIRAMGFEPGSHGRKERIDDIPSDTWRSAGVNYDIRHGHNLTPSRWSRDKFRSQRNCEGWQESHVNIEEIMGVQQAVA